jgi:GTP-binding protein YchF
LKVALLGLLGSGKSTLFSAISGRPLAPIGSTAIEEAIVSVPDPRLDWLAEIYQPKKITHASVDCVDLPGLNFTDEHSRHAAKHWLEKVRTVDLLVPVVRAFDNQDIPPYRGRIDPAKDLAELLTELLLSDLELVTTRIERLEKQIAKPSKTHPHDEAELALHKKLQQTIEAEKPISSAIENDTELELIKSLGFLTLKPMAIAVNVGEQDLTKTFVFSDITTSGTPVISISAKIEYELSQLDPESRTDFMADLGIAESAVSKFVHSCYSALGLISFLTVVSGELRAWPIPQGTHALDAAGKVHSDIKRGFIKAETISFDDLKALGSEKAVRAAGKVRLEGKDYIVRDGDIIHFRFNV